ncbi:MAG TPA: VCBS repeat-containing protein, partial [Armatimonadota bacterium]|nr:VCBS repeat-containing protein [Armatimonadota bacterium]
EESPYFSDEDRLRITNAFSRQLTWRAREGVYGRTSPGASVGNRHGDWAAMSLWVLARYFDKYYQDPIWTCALDSVKWYFKALDNSTWLAGMNDHLFWYTSYYDPILDYMIMSGERPGVANGNLAQALKTQDILLTGNEDDWGLKASSLNFLLRAAYLTGDGRFLYYMQRTGVVTGVFRLGQSFWPDPSQQPRPPTELLDTWTMQPMPEPMWVARGKPLPLENQFLWGSYRNALDASGDYLLIKGHNGGGRNPYHTFVPLELRLAGFTLLKGYGTQALTSADGMVEPQVAMDSQLLAHDALGQTVTAVGDTPAAAFCDWKRTLAQRVGRWCLFVDDLAFRTDSENVTIETTWQPVGATWVAAENRLTIQGSGSAAPQAGWLRFPALQADYTCGPGTPEELLSRLESISTLLLKATEPGTWVEMTFDLDEPVAGEVYADLLNYSDRGNVRLYLDGQVALEEFDHYAQSAIPVQAPLGHRELAVGEHRLRMEITGKRPESARMYGGLLGVSIRPDGVPDAPVRPQFELHPSELVSVQPGAVVTMDWRGPVSNGQHRRLFYLLGSKSPAEKLACLRLADNAAALALPEPALAVVGEYEGMSGELVIAAGDHLYGQGLSTVPGLLTSSAPVDVDWDYAVGTLHLAAAATDTDLTIGAGAEALTLDGKPAPTTQRGGATSLSIPAGRHVLGGATPDPAALSDLRERLAGLLEQAGVERERLAAAAVLEKPEAPPALAQTFAGSIGGSAVASLTYPTDRGDVLALAEGTTVHLIAPDGAELRTLQTEGEIMSMTWWDDHRLLVVGCKDEKVIAFDESGARRWEFTSEMDQAVWEAAKQYWFKSALPGIYGLHAGVFIDGKSQLFVGSACTLEMLDENGQLVKRLPIFWGPGWRFLLVNGPEESINLLVARWPNGNDTIAIVNNRSVKETGRSFYGVPAGHTMVGGWSAQNRIAMVYEDMDGDGTREVVTATNGVWNRVTVFSEAGAALFNAQFGPGSKTAYANLRDMAVADLDADGDREILVATSAGLIVALDHECRKLWSERTPTPPTQVEVVAAEGGAPVVFAGCEDGSVVAISPQGKTMRAGKADGRIVSMSIVRGEAGPQVVVATAKGEVKSFGVD